MTLRDRVGVPADVPRKINSTVCSFHGLCPSALCAFTPLTLSGLLHFGPSASLKICASALPIVCTKHPSASARQAGACLVVLHGLCPSALCAFTPLTLSGLLHFGPSASLKICASALPIVCTKHPSASARQAGACLVVLHGLCPSALCAFTPPDFGGAPCSYLAAQWS